MKVAFTNAVHPDENFEEHELFEIYSKFLDGETNTDKLNRYCSMAGSGYLKIGNEMVEYEDFSQGVYDRLGGGYNRIEKASEEQLDQVINEILALVNKK